MGRKPALKKSLDDLVLKLCHIELSECKDAAEFSEGIRLMVSNLEEILSALANYKTHHPRVKRAADGVKLMAVRLLELCRAIPEPFDHPERWRETAIRIAANYEQFRFEAGRFYRVAVPGSSFEVLRSAL